jgi:hypothetical protein
VAAEQVGAAERVVVSLRVVRGAVEYEVDAVGWVSGGAVLRLDAFLGGGTLLLEPEEKTEAMDRVLARAAGRGEKQ